MANIVAVILPIHNCQAYLDDCFFGLFKQTIRVPWEVSIYNDCSTDRSKAICMAWQRKFQSDRPHVTWIYGENQSGKPIGPGASRNRAVEQSSAEFLCIHDADDISHEDRLADQLEAAKQRPQALIGSKFVRLPADSTKRYTEWHNALTQEQLELQQYREVTLAQPTWFMTRKVFHRAGGYATKGDEEFRDDGSDANGFGLCEDLKFFYAHLDQTEQDYRNGAMQRLFMVPKPLVVYRYAPGSMSSKTPRRVLLRIRVRAFERRVLCEWPQFTIWGNGRDGRNFFNELKPEYRDKVKEFCDIDERKIRKGYYSSETNKHYDVVHFSKAKAPIVVCVALDRTEGELQRNVATLGLREGVDYYYFT